MTALDTNVLVRLIVRDDAEQASRAAAVLRTEECWVSSTVLLETEWVLRAAYGYTRDQVAQAFEVLLSLAGLTVEAPGTAATALAWHAGGMDFADAMHVAAAKDHERFATFDRSLARLGERLGARPRASEP